MMPSSYLSPYHLRLSDEEETHMHALENQFLLLSQQQQQGGASSSSPNFTGLLPFHVVATVLEQARSIPSKGLTRKEQHMNAVSGLLNEALEHPTNPTLQVLALLRVLLPSRDSRSVYGFKTTSLIRSFAKAIEKDGGVSGKAAAQTLLQSIRNPKPDEDGPHLVTMPEVTIAMAHARCFLSSSTARGKGPPLSLIEVAALCQKLTNIYRERHKQAVLTITSHMGGKGGMSIHIDSVAEVLGTVLTRLSYDECKVLVRLLLRTVPMGIGAQTVMDTLGPYLGNFLEVQQDLGRLAMAIVKYHIDNNMKQNPSAVAASSSSVINMMTTPGLMCGVPMTPMTCHTTSSPYLMKWLFTKQDTIKQYLSPKTGQLIIHSSGSWYVPLKSSGSITGRNRFVDLESMGAISIKNRKAHMLILREIRRYSPALIQTDKATGYVISYMLYLDEQTGGHVMLLQGVEPFIHKTIEFVDASVVLDDPKLMAKPSKMDANDDDHDPDYNPSNKNLRKKTYVKKTQQQIQEILQDMLSETAIRGAVQTPKGIVRISLMMIADEEAKNKQAKKTPNNNNGILVQRKLDGDRIQAHIMHDSKGNSIVKLFTKRGRPVHMLYTDVASELKQMILAKDQPCILDGELVVVDPDTNKPLPWSSTKWRYDSSSSSNSNQSNGGKRIDELTSNERKCTLTLVDGSSAYGYNPDDDEDSLTFAPHANALAQWSELGTAERDRLKVKVLSKGKLVFVVFDILMHSGVPLVSKACRQRLEILQKMASFKKKLSFKHVKVIDESWYVKNADELVEKLNYIIKEKGEGLILKNPDAHYEFTRTMHQRKLKICGPDINCGVVGLGFTLSRNPHQWGILTCIQSNVSTIEPVEAVPSSSTILLVYNRVETLEGDRIKTAAEHILGLSSLVSLHEVLYNSSREKPIQCGSYQIFVTYLVKSNDPEILEGVVVDKKSKKQKMKNPFFITWIFIEGGGNSSSHILYFLQGIPKDIQWLCNPFECRFGISQRGDMYPIDWNSNNNDEDDHDIIMLTKKKMIEKKEVIEEEIEEEEEDDDQQVRLKRKGQKNEREILIIQVPRFPVARIQLDDHQRSPFDTPISISEKFKEAADETQCVQRFITRKINQLRRKPPHPKMLEEIRRMLTAMEDPKEVWPKVCPTTFYLDTFSQMLIKHGHEPLNPAERMVLAGIPKASQWDPLLIQQIPLMHVKSQETTLMEAQYEIDKQRLAQRLFQLKHKAKRRYLINSFTRTGTNFMEHILDTTIKKGECFTTTTTTSTSSTIGTTSSDMIHIGKQIMEDNHDDSTSEEDEIESLCMDPRQMETVYPNDDNDHTIMYNTQDLYRHHHHHQIIMEEDEHDEILNSYPYHHNNIHQFNMKPIIEDEYHYNDDEGGEQQEQRHQRIIVDDQQQFMTYPTEDMYSLSLQSDNVSYHYNAKQHQDEEEGSQTMYAHHDYNKLQPSTSASNHVEGWYTEPNPIDWPINNDLYVEYDP